MHAARVGHLWLLGLVLTAPAAGQGVPGPEPVAELPGAGRPVDIAATTARRTTLLRRVGPGIVVVPAADQRDLEAEVLQDNDFRQDDYFFYLTELETPGALLVLAQAESGTQETTLFLPPRDPAQETWTGLKLGPGPVAARLSGITQVLSTQQLDSARLALLSRIAGPVYTIRGEAGGRAAAWHSAARPIRDIRPTLDSMRVVKDADEIDRLRRAIAITTQAQQAAMRRARPGLWEYQLEATVEFTFRDLGADRVGFPSIVGSGPNSTTLHYDANRRRMREGDLVVVDIGAEWGQYTADVTRTMPVSGRFTLRQRQIYDLVLGAQQAAIDAVKPGVTVRELNSIARSYLQAHSGELCAPKTCADYFIHGLSHWLGMRVHDVGDYRMPLQAGMVLTIEPGVYLPEEGLGVRIEDDVLVTATGHELLSAGAPRRAEDVEHLMKFGTPNPVQGANDVTR